MSSALSSRSITQGPTKREGGSLVEPSEASGAAASSEVSSAESPIDASVGVSPTGASSASSTASTVSEELSPAFATSNGVAPTSLASEGRSPNSPASASSCSPLLMSGEFWFASGAPWSKLFSNSKPISATSCVPPLVSSLAVPFRRSSSVGHPHMITEKSQTTSTQPIDDPGRASCCFCRCISCLNV